MTAVIDHSIIATIGVTDTVALFWDSLGVFRYLFAAILLVIVVFVGNGWRLLRRMVCPLNFHRPLADSDVFLLNELAHSGISERHLVDSLFADDPAPDHNIFYRYLKRFNDRDRECSLPPSLLEASDEMHEIARIQHASVTARFLAAILPAIGLLGTLVGMFNAFFGSDFSRGDEMAATMQELMRNFSLALFTTIAAVLLKIGVDLFNHFTLEIYVTRLRGELLRLRSLMLDLANGKPPVAPAPIAKKLTEVETS